MRAIILTATSSIILLTAILFASCDLAFRQTYSGADSQEKDQLMWTNMRDVQIAAEHYAANNKEGKYPTLIDDAFKSFLPGGGEDNVKPRPVGLINPYTGVNVWPKIGTITNIIYIRNTPAKVISPGIIEYSPIGNGKGYAIVGGAANGLAMLDYDGQVLVFTNFSKEDLENTKCKPNR